MCSFLGTSSADFASRCSLSPWAAASAASLHFNICCRKSTRSYRTPPGHTELHHFLQNITRSYRTSPSFKEYHMVLQNTTQCYRTPPSATEHNPVLQNTTQCQTVSLIHLCDELFSFIFVINSSRPVSL